MDVVGKDYVAEAGCIVSLFGNRKHFSLTLDEYSTTEGVFVGLNGVYTLIKKVDIPDTLILPKDCRVLILGENLLRKASKLKMCTGIVINPNLNRIDNGNLGNSFISYAESIKTIYLPSKFSKADMIKTILELAMCELNDILEFKYRALGGNDDTVTLDVLKKFFQCKFGRSIDIKLY